MILVWTLRALAVATLVLGAYSSASSFAIYPPGFTAVDVMVAMASASLAPFASALSLAAIAELLALSKQKDRAE